MSAKCPIYALWDHVFFLFLPYNYEVPGTFQLVLPLLLLLLLHRFGMMMRSTNSVRVGIICTLSLHHSLCATGATVHPHLGKRRYRMYIGMNDQYTMDTPEILRGARVNRTHGRHKNLNIYFSIFTNIIFRSIYHAPPPAIINSTRYLFANLLGLHGFVRCLFVVLDQVIAPTLL